MIKQIGELKIEVFKKNLNNNNSTIHNNQSIYTVNRYNHTTIRQYNKQRYKQYVKSKIYSRITE